MHEPTERATSGSDPVLGPGAGAEAYEPDVLLIADEPRAIGLGWRQHADPAGHTSQQHEAGERLDVESVVRKLIALLSEESRP